MCINCTIVKKGRPNHPFDKIGIREWTEFRTNYKIIVPCVTFSYPFSCLHYTCFTCAYPTQDSYVRFVS